MSSYIIIIILILCIVLCSWLKLLFHVFYYSILQIERKHTHIQQFPTWGTRLKNYIIF